MDLALLTGFEHTEVAVFIWCVGLPVAREQCAQRVLHDGGARMGELPHGTPKLGERRSGAVEAGGVTCVSNAHLRPPSRCRPTGRVRRVAPADCIYIACINGPMCTTWRFWYVQTRGIKRRTPQARGARTDTSLARTPS